MKKNKGFTLIESLIVVGVIAIIIPALFALFFSHLRAQSKVYLLQQVKQNGDNALNVIETLIKENTISIHSGSPPTSGNQVCTDASSTYSSTMYFLDRSGSYFNFAVASNKIASSSSVSSTVNLTSDKVAVTSFALSCAQGSSFSDPIVSVSFTVSQANSVNRPDESATLQYQTKMKLRPD